MDRYLDALQPYKIPGPKQVPAVLPYLEYRGEKHYDIDLEVSIKIPSGEEKLFLKQL